MSRRPGPFLLVLACALLFAATPRAQTAPAPSNAPQTAPAPTPGTSASPGQARPGMPGMPQRDPSRQQPQDSGSAIIQGRVVALDTGAPLRRVQLRLNGGNLRQGRATLTDAQGQYEFKDLNAGRYGLTATKGGYVSLQYGQRGPTDSGRQIELADHQTLQKVDLALPRGAVIQGRVVDETGEPVADVPVMALQYRLFQGRRRLVPNGRSGSTNDIGQYRIYGLPPGDYYVSAAVRPGFNGPMDTQMDDPTGYAQTFFPNAPSPAEAQRLTLGVGEEAAADIQLTPTRLSHIAGSVVTSAGKPPNGGMVMLQVRAGEMAAMGPGGGGVIRPDGSFVINGVANGSYNLITNVMLPDAPQGEQRETGMLPVIVGGQDVNDVRLTTTRGVTVSGHVSFDGGTPDANIAKSLRPSCAPIDPESNWFGGMAQPTPPNDQGVFEIKGLVAPCLIGVYGGTGWTLKSVTLNGVDITERGIQPGGKPIQGLEVTLTNRLTTLSGVVQDAQSQPAKEYTVIVFPEDSQKWQAPPPIATRYMRRARPDQTGAFKLTGMPPARYLVVALDNVEQGMEFDPEFLTRLEPLATRAELIEGGTQNLSLKISTASASPSPGAR